MNALVKYVYHARVNIMEAIAVKFAKVPAMQWKLVQKLEVKRDMGQQSYATIAIKQR
jgi:hypothetical protein